MSQNDEIRKYLQQGYSLTSMGALALCGCFRLAARIKDLRDEGHNIKTETVLDNGKSYARYHMLNTENRFEDRRREVAMGKVYADVERNLEVTAPEAADRLKLRLNYVNDLLGQLENSGGLESGSPRQCRIAKRELPTWVLPSKEIAA